MRGWIYGTNSASNVKNSVAKGRLMRRIISALVLGVIPPQMSDTSPVGADVPPDDYGQ